MSCAGGTSEDDDGPAASGFENQYLIDGVNVSYGGLGWYSISFSLDTGMPFDYINVKHRARVG